MSDFERRRAALFEDMAALFEFFSYDIEAVLERCITAARRIRDFDQHALLLLKPTGEVSAYLSEGLSLPVVQDGLKLSNFYPGEPSLYVVSDVSASTANILFPTDGEIRSYVTVPLVTQDDVIGLLMLGSRVRAAFTDEDLDLFFPLGSHLAVAMENIRHFQRAEERLKALVSLQESYKAIASDEDLDKILSRVADEAVRTLGIAAMAVYMLDEGGSGWERTVFRATAPSATAPARVSARELPGPMARALASTGLRFLSDAEIEQIGLFRFSPRYLRIAILPLRGDRQSAVGFALMETPALEADHLRMVEIFSRQVQILFTNAMLVTGLRQKSEEIERSHRMVRDYADKLQKSHEQLEARVKELSTLQEVNMALTTRTDVDETLEFILTEACTVVRADKGSLLLLEGDELVAKCSRGLARDALTTFRIGDGIAGWVAKTGQPYISKNILDDPNYKTRASESTRAETLLAVPLSIESHCIGVLNVEREVKFGVFSPDEERLLVSLGTAAARALEKARHFDDLKNLNRETLEAFAQAVDTKDAYTHGHSRRVSALSVELARLLRISEEDIEILERAALLHDVGKIGISNSILFKPGRLTEEEYEIMKAHVIFGENILKPIKMLASEARIVRHHHERWDGAGYPDRLKGEEIPIGSAIIGVADAYDTMTSDRPYRRAIEREKAIEEMKRCSGSQFNPLVVGALVSLFSRDTIALEVAKPAKVAGELDRKRA